MRYRLVAMLVVMAALIPFTVHSQGFPTSLGLSSSVQQVPPMGNEPIAVGPFLFSPGLQLGWERHSNLYRTTGGAAEDDIYLARLRLLFEVPVRESFVRISYTPQYRESKNRELHNNWDHFFEVSGDFEFSSGLTLGAYYRLVDGDTATSEVDPGYELVFSGQKFTKHTFGINSDYWFTARDGLTLNLNAEKVEWRGDQNYEGHGWYDYNRTWASVGWLHQLGSLLVMDLSYRYTDYSPEDYDQRFRKYNAHDITLGLRGQLNHVFSTELRLGYMKSDFANATAAAPEVFEDFSGFVINGNVTWALGHGSTLRLDLRREPFASNYDINPYYDTLGARLLYDLDFGRFFGQARAGYQVSDYQLPDTQWGIVRDDDLLIFGLGLGFRFTDKLALRGSYIYEDRDSTIPTYAYLNKVILIDLILGY